MSAMSANKIPRHNIFIQSHIIYRNTFTEIGAPPKSFVKPHEWKPYN